MKFILNKITHYLSHPLTKGSFVILAGSMVANVGAYIYHVLMGRLLGPVTYGEFSALMSLFYLINIGSGVVQTVLTKFFSQLRARKSFSEIPTLFWLAFRGIGIGTLVGLGVAVILSGWIGAFLHIQSIHFIWLYFIFATYVFSIINVSMLQSFQLFVASSVLTNAGTLLRIIFGIIGAPFGLSGILIGNVLSNTLTYILYFIPVWGLLHVKSKELSITKVDTIQYSIPALLGTLGVVALYSQDVLLVKHFFPANEAGIYASLATLGKVIFYASAALGYVMFPMIVERKELKQPHINVVLISLSGVMGLSLLLTLGYFLFPSVIVRLMYGSSFDGAIPYMGLFGLFITFFSFVNVFTTVFLALGKTKVWIITMGAALLQFIGLWIFHVSLYQVVYVNIAVTFMACVALLIYYLHGDEQS